MATFDLTSLDTAIPEHIKDFDFSYITRYKILATLIETAARDIKKPKVLDVGGYNGPLENFFPKLDLTILDIAEHKAKNYVKASGSKMPFKDGHFDIVVSSDTLEHITPENRHVFISEMLRVSDNYVILGAPFRSPQVVEAEKIADGFYKSMTGNSYIWLKEHREYGLPETDWLDNILSKNNLMYRNFKHTSVNLWALMVCGSFFLAGNIGAVLPELGRKLKKGNTRYLKNIAYQDFPADGYRTFYVISKKNKIDINLPNYTNTKINDFLENEVGAIGSVIMDFSKQFGRIRDELKAAHELAHSFDIDRMRLQKELDDILSSKTYKIALGLAKTKRRLHGDN